MARGQRKMIEEKIEAKDIDFLYKFISKANLSPQEATGILEEHLQSNYEETA